MAKSLRMQRIDEELKKHIGEIITLELTNSNITGMVTVTKVNTTPDLKFAKVFVSVYGSKNKEKTLEGLNKSKGYVRSMIAKRVNLRTTPEIVFELDETEEKAARIDQILEDIKNGKI